MDNTSHKRSSLSITRLIDKRHGFSGIRLDGFNNHEPLCIFSYHKGILHGSSTARCCPRYLQTPSLIFPVPFVSPCYLHAAPAQPVDDIAILTLRTLRNTSSPNASSAGIDLNPWRRVTGEQLPKSVSSSKVSALVGDRCRCRCRRYAGAFFSQSAN